MTKDKICKLLQGTRDDRRLALVYLAKSMETNTPEKVISSVDNSAYNFPEYPTFFTEMGNKCTDMTIVLYKNFMLNLGKFLVIYSEDDSSHYELMLKHYGEEDIINLNE